MRKALVFRCGAVGDMLESGSICAGIKKTYGHHITLMGVDHAVDAVHGNPYVDEFRILWREGKTPEQIDAELYDIVKAHDFYYPLIQVAEGHLLVGEPTQTFRWPPAARHKVCNFNYLELLHQVAGVPYEPRVKFYPSPEEMQWAEQVKAEIQERFILLLVVNGSSPNKVWPHTEAFIREAVKDPDLHIILTGTETVFDRPWVKHKQVNSLCGKTTLRQALSLVYIADAILGPETAIMQAASRMDVPKIIMLSHSTEENLTKDWPAVYPLTAQHVVCQGRGNNDAPACHQIHHSWDTCTRVTDRNCLSCRSGHCTKHLSACQQAILPEMALSILRVLTDRFLSDKTVRE